MLEKTHVLFLAESLIFASSFRSLLRSFSKQKLISKSFEKCSSSMLFVSQTMISGIIMSQIWLRDFCLFPFYKKIQESDSVLTKILIIMISTDILIVLIKAFSFGNKGA